jgi:hypothetical protein
MNSVKTAKQLLLLALMLLFSLRVSAIFAKDFSSDIASDRLTQNRQRPSRQQIPIPQTIPDLGSSSTISSNLPDPALQSFPPPSTSLPQSSLITDSLQSSMQTPQLSNPIQIRPTKISVPNYEEKYLKMIEALKTKAAQKKKTLIASILDEIDRYGIPINIALIIFVIVFAIRREQRAAPKEELENKKEGESEVTDF